MKNVENVQSDVGLLMLSLKLTFPSREHPPSQQ